LDPEISGLLPEGIYRGEEMKKRKELGRVSGKRDVLG